MLSVPLTIQKHSIAKRKNGFSTTRNNHWCKGSTSTAVAVEPAELKSVKMADTQNGILTAINLLWRCMGSLNHQGTSRTAHSKEDEGMLYHAEKAPGKEAPCSCPYSTGKKAVLWSEQKLKNVRGFPRGEVGALIHSVQHFLWSLQRIFKGSRSKALPYAVISAS